MSRISSFKSIENKHDVYRGKDCIKNFCESLREHAMKIVTFKKKKMKLLTKGQQESYENAKIYYNCKEKLEIKYVKDKKYRKVRGHSIITFALGVGGRAWGSIKMRTYANRGRGECHINVNIPI